MDELSRALRWEAIVGAIAAPRGRFFSGDLALALRGDFGGGVVPEATAMKRWARALAKWGGMSGLLERGGEDGAGTLVCLLFCDVLGADMADIREPMAVFQDTLRDSKSSRMCSRRTRTLDMAVRTEGSGP